MVKLRSILATAYKEDMRDLARDLAHDELLMDEEERAGEIFDELMKEETNRDIHEIQQAKLIDEERLMEEEARIFPDPE